MWLMDHLPSTGFSVIGNEGMLGITLCMGGLSTPGRSLVQSGGYAYRLPRTRIKEEFDRHGQLMSVMLRYTRSLFIQLGQTAVCNRLHSTTQQLCRWLLMSIDRLPHCRLTMTQEFIGHMLGVRRETITMIVTKLEELGAVSHSRGTITVLDRTKLETLSCECYFVVKNECDRLLDFVPQRQIIKNPNSIRTATLPSSAFRTGVR